MVELLYRDEIKPKVSHALLIMYTGCRPNSVEYIEWSVGTSSRILNIDSK